MEDLARDQVGSWRREQDRWIERAKRRERAWRVAARAARLLQEAFGDEDPLSCAYPSRSPVRAMPRVKYPWNRKKSRRMGTLLNIDPARTTE
jgi:hypothetical protein